MELMLTGRMIDAQEAVDMGLVNKVVPHEELGDAVLKTARAIAANGRNAVRLTKRAVRAGQDIDVQAGCEIEASIWALSFDEERTARMTAFLEKRKK
jgi:enoyl-CoA hydratase